MNSLHQLRQPLTAAADSNFSLTTQMCTLLECSLDELIFWVILLACFIMALFRSSDSEQTSKTVPTMSFDALSMTDSQLSSGPPTPSCSSVSTQTSISKYPPISWHGKTFALINVKSDTALDVQGGNVEGGGSKVHGWSFSATNPNQQWILETVRDGDPSSWTLMNARTKSKPKSLAK